MPGSLLWALTSMCSFRSRVTDLPDHLHRLGTRVEEVGLVGRQRLEAEIDARRADRRHDPLEDLDRVTDGLVIGHARQQVALLGRAEHHERAAQVAGRLGQGDQVVARRAGAPLASGEVR